MAKQNITVKIIGKPYPLAIDGEKEEMLTLQILRLQQGQCISE